MNTSEYLPFDPIVAPKKRLPRGTVDCHFHVFEDPKTYPYTANRSYTPSLAPWAAFEKMNDTIGADRAVLVHPSVYGYDHRTLYDTMQAHPDRLRAVGVLQTTNVHGQRLASHFVRLQLFAEQAHLEAIARQHPALHHLRERRRGRLSSRYWLAWRER